MRRIHGWLIVSGLIARCAHGDTAAAYDLREQQLEQALDRAERAIADYQRALEACRAGR